MTYQDFLDSSGEKKWQDYWEKEKLFEAKDGQGEKFYCLVEFPYPSAEGLHVGHPRSYTALDIVARKRRMEGYNVLYPMGFDAFGLPAENYAIKTGIHPRLKTEDNVNNYRRQLKSLGFSFDWSREINTTNPEYYKWTQWIFLKLFEHGLAYKAEATINFCTVCKVGLANEEVVGGKCERCGGEVVKKIKSQWLLKITDYADRLEKDLDKVDYIEQVKTQQRNWIGRSEGATVEFKILNFEFKIDVYTTRPDTLFGATYMVLAPEHELVPSLKERIENFAEVEKYINQAAKKSDLERTELSKEKTGVELKGIKAINPVNGKEMPIWISDYVLAGYGTGAIMAVPAHDERDYEFAKKFGLEIIAVIKGGDISQAAYTDIDKGEMINSDFLDGLLPNEAIKKMIAWLEEKGVGKAAVNHKLRDWVFSRQRYWGEPIPLIFCENCAQAPKIKGPTLNKGELLNPGWFADENLPLELPEIKEFQAGEDGESPLAKLDDWVKVKCPKCGGEARRETDTMPQWAGSSWYFLRYCDPNNQKALASEKQLKYWTPVDWYNGGMEHTTLHLLYSRFWHKFLFDIGVAPTDEPYRKRTSHGMVLGAGGEKMSKSRGNVINPDEVVKEYGADTLRVYEMFMGPFDQAIPWDTKGVVGVRRFLDKVWNLFTKDQTPSSQQKNDNEIEILLNKTIKKVSEDIEAMRFNTAVSALMILVNKLLDQKQGQQEILEKFLVLLSPFAPHIAEELWQQRGHSKSIAAETWPAVDQSKLQSATVEFAVQINGKLRATVVLPQDIKEEAAVAAVRELENVKKYLASQEIKKTIFVPGRLVSFVTSK
ncbi:MAG TPA: leucine--tRNA ligase [bacterium]|nr:leucine--tRNA ligase [bacterium]HPN81310.1 leucine--tRNA ligase [bacterium]HPW39831.1 leucine--tRNA ligase [bacterium]